MNEPRSIDFDGDEKPRSGEMLRPRAVGSPLAMGLSSRAPAAQVQAEPRTTPALPQSIHQPEQADQPAESVSTGDDSVENPKGLQRAMNGLRAAWPFVQKILPLLDGQVVTAVTNLLTPHPAVQAQVNLAPIEKNMTELQIRHAELSDQMAEQNASLKKVEDRLEQVREATDRNTLEQQELLQDLKSVGRKVNIVAVIAILLLAGSIAVNVVLYLHIMKVLP